MNANVFALTGLLMLFPASTVAQTTAQPSLPPTSHIAASIHEQAMAAASAPGALQWDANRRYVNDRVRRVFDNTSPARIDRAERAAALVDAGDCSGAQALAMQENDRRLARRIEQICQAKN
jgi:hypothetical protein